MIIRLLIIVILAGFITGCRSGEKEMSRLNIVLFGYDSLACYYGNSANMIDLRYGKLTDTLFMDSFLTTAIDRKPDTIALKPGDGAGVLGNWEHLDTMFKRNHFDKRMIDTLDEKEQHFFKTTSIIPYLMERQKEPLRLFLPKDDEEPVRDTSGKAFVVLLLANNEVYAYNGRDVTNGKKCTYQELQSYLATQKKDPVFSVIIKPGENSSYKNVVDVLDLMTIEKIKKYKLEDVTDEERAIVNKASNEKAAL